MMLIPERWKEFQHYKNRCPPWIKLHRDLLNDREFMGLPLASKALAPLLWLLASEEKDGCFQADSEELAFRLRIASKDIEEGLKPLINKGFFIVASEVLAECQQDASPEGEGEGEREREAEKRTCATRLPADWKPSKEQTQYCKDKRPDLDVEDVVENFKGYWLSKPTQNTKLDWDLTWNNWVRNEKVKPKVAKPTNGAPDWLRSRSA